MPVHRRNKTLLSSSQLLHRRDSIHSEARRSQDARPTVSHSLTLDFQHVRSLLININCQVDVAFELSPRAHSIHGPVCVFTSACSADRAREGGEREEEDATYEYIESLSRFS